MNRKITMPTILLLFTLNTPCDPPKGSPEWKTFVNTGKIGGDAESMNKKAPFSGAFFAREIPDVPQLPAAVQRRIKLWFGEEDGSLAISYNTKQKPKAEGTSKEMKTYGRYLLESADKKNNQYVFTLYDVDYAGPYVSELPEGLKAPLSSKKKIGTMTITMKGKEGFNVIVDADPSKTNLIKGEKFFVVPGPLK